MDDLSQKIIDRFREHQANALAIMTARQAKYGPWNIAAAGADGVLTRMGDKLARLANLTEFQDDSNADGHYDIGNYGIIRLMVLEGSWPQLTLERQIAALKAKIRDDLNRLEELMAAASGHKEKNNEQFTNTRSNEIKRVLVDRDALSRRQDLDAALTSFRRNAGGARVGDTDRGDS